MGKMMYKIRTILRNLYIALGATVMPYLVHAGYGQPQIDPKTLTVPFQGRIVSEETSEPIAGISIYFRPGYAYMRPSYTDDDGRFLFYLPEKESYDISFQDNNGFQGGGFFLSKDITIARDEIENPLTVSLNRESEVAVIHGTVRFEDSEDKPVTGSRISISAYIVNDNGSETFDSYFDGSSDNDGNFFIQVPKRDHYRIRFSDIDWRFQRFEQKGVFVTFDEIQNPLHVELEKRELKKTDEDGK